MKTYKPGTRVRAKAYGVILEGEITAMVEVRDRSFYELREPLSGTVICVLDTSVIAVFQNGRWVELN